MSAGGTLEVGQAGGGQSVLEVWACATEVETIAVVRSPLCLRCQSGTETHATLEFLTIPAFNKTETAGLVGFLKVHFSQAPSVTAQRFLLHRRNQVAYCYLSGILIICASTTKKRVLRNYCLCCEFENILGQFIF